MAAHDPTNPLAARAELADIRDALAGIAAVAALLAGADPDLPEVLAFERPDRNAMPRRPKNTH